MRVWPAASCAAIGVDRHVSYCPPDFTLVFLRRFHVGGNCGGGGTTHDAAEPWVVEGVTAAIIIGR